MKQSTKLSLIAIILAIFAAVATLQNSIIFSVGYCFAGAIFLYMSESKKKSEVIHDKIKTIKNLK